MSLDANFLFFFMVNWIVTLYERRFKSLLKIIAESRRIAGGWKKLSGIRRGYICASIFIGTLTALIERLTYVYMYIRDQIIGDTSFNTVR